jgi:hypothetical protein
MTTRFIPATLAIASLFTFLLPADALAAKGDKKAVKRQGSALAKFDKNGDGSIDGKEANALRKHYEPLAALDTDHDGKLSDSEISAAKVGKGKGGAKKQKKAGATKQKGGKKKKGAKKQA